MTQTGVLQSVVVIDDNPAFCAMVQEILEDEGFLVTSCTDSRAALRAVIELQPDLVISDWWLRCDDGERIAQVIRRDPRTAHLPVVVCTADGMIHDEIETLSLHDIVVIRKPFDLTDFVAAVRRQLDGNADTVH
jgi:CheY-like chemotaxis protein